jgi:hypothetical protein
MNETVVRASHNVFAYPSVDPSRCHGPKGYADYRAYKPWLRDDFAFRCIYCLTRERWYPSGHEEFGVDHVKPRSVAPDLIVDYDNLLYACSSCNRNRQEAGLPMDPARAVLGEHLRMTADGTVEALTNEGRALIRTCHLNRPLLLHHRRHLPALINLPMRRQSASDESLLCGILGFPDDLPDVASKRPPGGDTRPDVMKQSCFAQRKRGELPGVY